jgi:hypothetical protein
MSINMRQLLSASVPEGGEKVRLLVIGSVEGVTEVIHTLHSLGYAEVRDWSRIVPIPDGRGIHEYPNPSSPPRLIDAPYSSFRGCFKSIKRPFASIAFRP